jgi:hypothetical protein
LCVCGGGAVLHADGQMHRGLLMARSAQGIMRNTF